MKAHARSCGRACRDKSAPRKRIAPVARLDQSKDHARQGGLAAPGFADDREDLGRFVGDGEAHIIDRTERRAAEEPAPRIDLASRYRPLASRSLMPPPPSAPAWPESAGSAAKHATRWPGASSVSAGFSRRQTSIASGQRGWNRQPGGGAERFGGVPPSAFFGATSPMRGRLSMRCAV